MNPIFCDRCVHCWEGDLPSTDLNLARNGDDDDAEHMKARLMRLLGAATSYGSANQAGAGGLKGTSGRQASYTPQLQLPLVERLL